MKPRAPHIAALSSALLLAVMAARPAHALEDDERRYFNVRAGPVYMTLNAGVETQFTDNANLANGTTTAKLSDIIVTPHLGLTASSEMQLLPEDETNRTTLSLTAGIGYENHLLRPELNRNMLDLNLAPDSMLSFLIHAGPLKIRLFDGFSLQSDPVGDGSLSNVAQFRRFTNAAGADILWPINSQTTANLNYVHRNLWALDMIGVNSAGQATNLNTSNYDNSSDTVSGSISGRVLSWLDLGMSGSVTENHFPSTPDQDSISTSYGPTATIRFTDYTSLALSTGLSHYELLHDGSSGSDTEYATATLTNKFNRFYTQTLSVGRQTTLDMLGAQTQVDFIRYTSAWRMNSHITISSSLGVDKTEYPAGTAGALGNSDVFFNTGPYKMIHGDISTQYRLSRKLSTSLSYRYSNKIASDSLQDYKQNMLIWTVTYNF